MFRYILLLFFSCTTLPDQAQTLRGKITDAENGEPLTGAAILLDSTNYYAIAGFDGSFKIPNVEKKNYQLIVRYIGYKNYAQQVEINGDVNVNIGLELNSALIQDVIVTAITDKSTMVSARNSERKSESVLNVISAKTIELSPDISVADVVQRVSGVSLDYAGPQSETHAIIRGMPKRYNYTLVNGIKIPSPDDKQRYVPLDIFPAALLDRLEVYKSLTPSMEGDAAGGVVNMVMKNAPQKSFLSVNLSTGYNQMLFERNFVTFNQSYINTTSPYEINGPNYAATMSDFSTKNFDLISKPFSPDLDISIAGSKRFLKNKLGVIVATSYTNNHKTSESVRMDAGSKYDNDEQRSRPTLEYAKYRLYYNDSKRTGLHTKIDYNLNYKNTLSLYSAYINLSENRVREEDKLRIWGSENETYPPHNIETRYRRIVQNITTSTLEGKHNTTNLGHFNWSLSYSKAEKQRPDNAVFARILTEKWTAGNYSELVTEDGDNYREWRYNTDKDYAAYFDYTVEKQTGLVNTEIKTGGMYRIKQRNSFINTYTLDPQPPKQGYGENWKPDTESDPNHIWLMPDENISDVCPECDPSLMTISRYSNWTSYSDVQFKLNNPKGSTRNPLNYDSHENYMAFYLQAKITINENLELLGGVRYEKAEQGFDLLAPKASDTITSLTKPFQDVLPSLHLKYLINKHANIRASYYYSVIRPGFFEIIPSLEKNEDDYTERGNPNLEATNVHNFDIRYENYFNNIDYLKVGIYYKRIFNPIEEIMVKDTSETRGNIYAMPMNFNLATNYGFEVDFVKYIRQFGFSANYTFTISEITTNKGYLTRINPNDPSTSLTTITKKQTRPLSGQSKHIANATLLYKNNKQGINGQLSFVYTGERIKDLNFYYNFDEWEKPFYRFDLSLEKNFAKKYTVFFKVKNLLNTPYKVFIKEPLLAELANLPYQGNTGDYYLTRRDKLPRTFRIGVKFKFN